MAPGTVRQTRSLEAAPVRHPQCLSKRRLATRRSRVIAVLKLSRRNCFCNYRCGLSFGSKVTPSRNAGAVTPWSRRIALCHAPKTFPPPSPPTQEVRAVISQVRHRDSKSVFKKSHQSDAIEHKACCGDFDECLRALHAVLVILAQSSIAAKPSEAALTIQVRPVGLNARRRRLTICSLHENDALVVWKLDRLGRTVRGLVDLVGELEHRRVHFQSLTDGINTKTPAGRFYFHVMASLAQMERELLVERTRAGLVAAKKLGRVGGRKRRMTESKIQSGKTLLISGVSPKEVARNLGVSIPTLYRWLPASERS